LPLLNVTSTAAADTARLVAEVTVAHPLRKRRPINSREAFALIDIGVLGAGLI
jgi:hypothetical protein